MCIAVAKEAGVVITPAVLERCFNANPDGAGFCVEGDGKLLIKKGYFTFKEFMDAFQPYEERKALIHFRIKTHGPVNMENCHPFQVTEDVAFIHNGIINNVPNDPLKSDTRVFKEKYLQPLINLYGMDILQTGMLQGLIEKFIGASKLVLMQYGVEGFTFFNKSMGNESKEGIWFSNYSWQEPQLPTHYKNPKYDKYSDFWDETTRSQAKPKAPVVEILKAKIKGSDVSFGTVVKSTCTIKLTNGTLIPAGSTGEVERVYSNGTVDIDFYKEGPITGVYNYSIEAVTEFSPEFMKLAGWQQ